MLPQPPLAAEPRFPLVSLTMRPPDPRRSRHDPTRGRVRTAAWLRAACLVLLGLSAAAHDLACASSGGAPRRNGMEAPPPFPVAPDFSVPDSRGVLQSLGSLMGPRGLVLVLYRGHW
jgi:hypothetical protein